LVTTRAKVSRWYHSRTEEFQKRVGFRGTPVVVPGWVEVVGKRTGQGKPISDRGNGVKTLLRRKSREVAAVVSITAGQKAEPDSEL